MTDFTLKYILNDCFNKILPLFKKKYIITYFDVLTSILNTKALTYQMPCKILDYNFNYSVLFKVNMF